MRQDVRRWFTRRTYNASLYTAAGLADARQASPGTLRISVVLPALDEERTVGDIVSAIRADLMDEVALVDELVVIDAGSSDRTAAVAAAAGATVVDLGSVLPDHGRLPGKGEALWKSLYATTGDLVVFVDADLEDFSSHFVVGLLGPLIADPTVQYVKATYDRPLLTEAGVVPTGGGRVTELLARPLLNAYWPRLAGFVQPLSGEYAGRRRALEQVPFVSDYGVELGLLIDLLDRVGLDGLSQVDLGQRVHRHQTDAALGRMAGQVLQTALSRLPGPARPAPSRSLTQFVRGVDGGYELVTSDVAVTERPPMIEVPEYVASRRPEVVELTG